MSEFGDDMRAWRDHKRKVRRTWEECPTCALNYGTGTKVPPGGTCHNCGWKAPEAPDEH